MKMKKSVFSAALAALLIMGLSTSSAEASGITPGSAADPLVTQSYVDDKYDFLYNQLAGQNGGTAGLTSEQRRDIIDEVLTLVEQSLGISGSGTGTLTGTSTGALYTPVFANSGQVILGGEGTEIVLRSGTAVAYVPVANGLSDLTTGWDIRANEAIQTNHLIIVPRNDGRGIQVTSDAWLLIKGSYTIH